MNDEWLRGYSSSLSGEEREFLWIIVTSFLTTEPKTQSSNSVKTRDRLVVRGDCKVAYKLKLYPLRVFIEKWHSNANLILLSNSFFSRF